MRIVHLSSGYWPRIGGVETLLYRLIACQRAAGHEVSVWTEHPFDSLPLHEVHEGVSIHRIPFTNALRSGSPEQLRRAVDEVTRLKREQQPDLIHVHVFSATPWVDFLTQAASKAPTVMTLHTPLEHLGFPREILRRILERGVRVTAVSEATRQNCVTLGGAWTERTCVISNGVPAPTEMPAPLPSAPPTLLSFGRLDPTKGFHVAIRAMARLRADWPELSLTIAGDGADRQRLEKLRDELGLQDVVRLCGWIEPNKIPEAINRATAVLVPSTWEEPFGLVAVEASLMARPVIASAVGGLKGIVRDGVTGLLVPGGDEAALAGAIERLLCNPREAEALGQAARAHVREAYSMERCAAEYERVYADAIASMHTPLNYAQS
ncbi:MAG: glycosyltransferase family 4 protein [Opitutus sp.]|nr:glycosyltransferase family 4 protein [Opitutus sp.]